jgi:CRP-like cAMP-binding protein
MSFVADFGLRGGMRTTRRTGRRWHFRAEATHHGAFDRSALSAGAFVGHLSYGLLILSMLMTRMVLLRAFAIGSGLVALAYDIFWLFDPVGVFWESAFVAINVGQLLLLSYSNRIARFTREERAFYSMAVPALDPAQARKLLQLGRLREADRGTVLVVEDRPVVDLIFLLSGKAEILLRGEPVGDCRPGNFIGEIGVSTDRPASASAVVSESVRYLAFDGTAVRQLLDRDDVIGHALDTAFRHGLREKLLRTNDALVASGRSTALRKS